jgi:hypothetical protein
MQEIAFGVAAYFSQRILWKTASTKTSRFVDHDCRHAVHRFISKTFVNAVDIFLPSDQLFRRRQAVS